MTRSFFRRTVRSLLIVVATVSPLACAMRAAQKPEFVGHLRPGPQVAKEFPVLAGSVLQEVTALSIPAHVRKIAREQSVPFGARDECSRYFPADTVVLVVLSSFCGNHYGRDTDSRTIIAVSPQGRRLLKTFTWAPIRDSAELVPYYRFSDMNRLP